MNILRFNEYIIESVSLSEYKSIIFDALFDLGYRKRTNYITVEMKETSNHISLYLNRQLLITTWKLERLTNRSISNLKKRIEEEIKTNPEKYRL